MRTLAAASAFFFTLSALAAAQGAPAPSGANPGTHARSLFLGQPPAGGDVTKVVRVRALRAPDQKTAESVARNLKRAGYLPVDVDQATDFDNKRVYDVYVGEFATEDAASPLLADLKRNGYPEARAWKVAKTVAASPAASGSARLPELQRLLDLKQRQSEGGPLTDEELAIVRAEKRDARELQNKIKEIEEVLANQERERDAKAREEAEVNALLERVRIPFLEAIRERNWIRANDLIQEVAAKAPGHPQLRNMQDALKNAIEEEKNLKVAEQEIDALMQRARQAESEEKWEQAIERWQDVLNFPNRKALTTAIIQAAEEGIRRCNGQINKANYANRRWKLFVNLGIGGTAGCLLLLATWFGYSRLTEEKRIKKVMVKELPNVALPALEMNASDFGGVPQLEAPQQLALPGGSGENKNAKPAGRDSISGRRRPGRDSVSERRASSRASVSASRARSQARAVSVSNLQPAGGAAPSAPKTPDLSPAAEAKPAAAPSKPAAPAAEAKPAAPAPAPKKPEEKAGGNKLDLSGLPDLPGFDGIVGGAGGAKKEEPKKAESKPASAPAPAGTPGSSLTSAAAGLDFEIGGANAAPPSSPAPAAEAPSQPAPEAANNGAAKKEYFEQNFSGGDANGWEGAFDFATLEVVDPSGLGKDDAGKPQNCLKYEKESGSGQVYYSRQFPNATGRVTVEFDLCCVEKNRYLLGLYLEKDRDFRRSIHTVIHCANPRAKASLRLQGTPAGYEMGSWAKVRYDINMDRNTLTAFVDGAKVVDNEVVDNMPDAINTLAIRDNHPTTGVLLLSNIKVYDTPDA